jgi:hypothetical protein
MPPSRHKLELFETLLFLVEILKLVRNGQDAVRSDGRSTTARVASVANHILDTNRPRPVHFKPRRKIVGVAVDGDTFAEPCGVASYRCRYRPRLSQAFGPETRVAAWRNRTEQIEPLRQGRNLLSYVEHLQV